MKKQVELNNQSAQGNLPCPDCGTPIPMTIPLLLSGQRTRCRGCGLSIQVNARASHGSLKALRKFQSRLRDIRADAAR